MIIVHGGAWKIPESLTELSLSGVEKAVTIGYQTLLQRDSTALDAVEMAIRHLESDPVFDAGVGSCLTSEGTVEMDAAIMSTSSASTKSKKLELGGVACVSNVEHAISVARQVLNKGKHTLFVGKGANRFAIDCSNIPILKNSNKLITECMRQELKDYKNKYGQLVNNLFNHNGNHQHDTVGCVAIDQFGRIACGTSTGGITSKQVGRVGDSPISGSGLYCMNHVGGISSTGHGESIMKACLCKHILDSCFFTHISLKESAVQGLQFMNDVSDGGCGGVVALDCKGGWVAECTTERMVWACVDGDGCIKGGIERGQVKELGKVVGKVVGS